MNNLLTVSFLFFAGCDLCSGATAKQVLAAIEQASGAQPPANTVDTIKAGDPELQVTGIATTFMATLDVLQRAAAHGRNLVISHEPTFYTHLDRTAPFETDAVYQEKARFIRDHKMVVWRFHDTWHARKPDGILEGMVTALGWRKYQLPDQPHLFAVPETSLEQFAAQTRETLHIRNTRVVGNPQMKFRRVALLPGAAGSAAQIAFLRRNDVDVLVIGETPEWETVPYVQDATSEAKQKGLIILGHVQSEEQGMEECARWLKTFLTEIPVEFVPAREPYWHPAARSLSEQMNSVIQRGVVPGAVTLVATAESLGKAESFGYADPAMTKPMPADGIFWIASMTKPVTAAAIMILVDRGKLSVDDSLAKYIPDFAHFPQKITLRHLLTHTSGLSDLTDAESATARTLQDLVGPIIAKPLKFEPGTKWSYCQSGINMLGRVIEVVSGVTYEQFVQRQLLTPLDMKDTAFYLNDKQMARWIRPAKRDGDHFAQADISILFGKPPTSHDRYAAPNGGLFTTASDYARLAQMLLNKGVVSGHRILSEAAVHTMTAIQTTDDMDVGFTPGMAYGFGVGVVKQPQGVTDMLSPGTYGHGGAYGTQAWIDPVKNRIYILMVNRATLEGGDANAARYAFQDAVNNQ